MDEISIIDIWEFIKDKEYHKEEKLLFINNRDFEEFVKLFNEDFACEFLELYFKGKYFCVNLENMLDLINMEFTDELLLKMEENSD